MQQNLGHLRTSLTKFLKLPEIARLLKDGGYYAVIETSSCDRMAVPHVHIVLNLPSRFKNGANYIKPETFEKFWIDTVKIAGASSDIREIKQNDKQSLTKAVVARIQYLNKLSKLECLTKDKDFTYQFLNQTSGMILEKSGGTLAHKNVKLDFKNNNQNYELASADFQNDEISYYPIL